MRKPILKAWVVTIALLLTYDNAGAQWSQTATGLFVREVGPVTRPDSARGLGITVIEIKLDRANQPVTRVLRGDSPFLESALQALKGWHFAPASNTKTAFTTITFVFRPAVQNAVEIPPGPIVPYASGEGLPAVPRRIVDAGYPATCAGNGAVVLQLQIDSRGRVQNANALSGPAAFIDDAERAVKQWEFAPARIGSQAVSSTNYAVVVFIRPMTE
jgi:hypothetical protein